MDSAEQKAHLESSKEWVTKAFTQTPKRHENKTRFTEGRPLCNTSPEELDNMDADDFEEETQGVKKNEGR